ncbi:MBL fold metallo-hydrolase [Desulfovibrio sp. TomC]|uniref:MBL fold metallo-hydrolase n=1 Tax=Desulfovibrio sp. TomC TaxID=1562888 RepID=UPI000574DB73|nr:MBL fold metallo-hydrolase [Desulfovibrio sp. TomC]KHK01436.1 7,8 dihydropteroate synthase (methanopterin) [Desulfovibrio sp. TomC]
MELTVLIDNNTLTDNYLLGEPALSLYMEEGGTRVLLDCGYSDAACRNAARLGIDLAAIDAVALSHGHNDHTWGLVPLVACLTEQAAKGHPGRKPRLVAHPEALAPRRIAPGEPIGSLLGCEALEQCFDLTLSADPVPLTDRLLFLGEIPRLLPFETARPIGERHGLQGLVPDELPDDTALAYRSDDGLVIITGCSHAGICNIVEHARRVTGVRRVAAVIGGLHLLANDPALFAATADYLHRAGLAALYPCHCTGLAAKLALARIVPVHEVGSGLRLSFA